MTLHLLINVLKPILLDLPNFDRFKILRGEIKVLQNNKFKHGVCNFHCYSLSEKCSIVIIKQLPQNSYRIVNSLIKADLKGFLSMGLRSLVFAIEFCTLLTVVIIVKYKNQVFIIKFFLNIKLLFVESWNLPQFAQKLKCKGNLIATTRLLLSCLLMIFIDINLFQNVIQLLQKIFLYILKEILDFIKAEIKNNDLKCFKHSHSKASIAQQ